MPGLSDYAAQNVLNYVTGQVAMPTLPSLFAALFTAAPTADAGTGGTECSGNGYARVQVAGSATTNATTASGNATLHFASTPSWIVAGMYVRDATTSSVIPASTTVLSTTGTTVVMSANASGGGVGGTDVITFSAFAPATASTGTEPGVVPASVVNNAAITFPAATGGGAGFGTAVFMGLFDASTSGNYQGGDYLGAYNWLPATNTLASPGVITAHAHGYANGNAVAVTSKYGGALPTFSQSNFTNNVGTLLVANSTTDTFTVTNGGTAVNTSSTGDFSVRQVTPQSIPSAVTASFAASQVTLSLA